MAPAPSFRSRIAASAAALGLLFVLGCGGKGSSSSAADDTTATIQGKVTYTRIPLLKDVNGVPTGLETNPANFVVLPARGLRVRVYQHDTANGADRWVVRQSTGTDSNGNYTATVAAGSDVTVQVESATVPDTSGPSPVSVLADPNGLSSLVPETQRPLYIQRAAPDGTQASISNLLPVSAMAAKGTATLNFTLDQATTWLVGRTDLALDGSSPALTSAALEASPSGSRPAAILDSVYTFRSTYGNPALTTPLDLHYLVGHSEPEGSYIQFDQRHWVQPSGVDLAFDSFYQVDHDFGSIRGASANDDAWDEPVLFQLLARSFLYNQTGNYLYGRAAVAPIPFSAPIDGLAPGSALVEGLPAIMASCLLKSPYLADTDGSSALISVADVRDLSAVAPADQGPYSARTLSALLWELDLKACGITSPGTAAQWATMDPATIKRLFFIAAPSTSVTNPDGSVTTTASFVPPNIYQQLGLLKNAKGSTEPVDLSAIFSDTVLNAVASPFNLPWPQPSTTVFGQTWTSSAVNGPYTYTGTLSMSADHLVGGVYPNQSYQEIAYLGLSQITDQAYQLSLQTTPSALPAGATIQVVVFAGTATQTYTFTGAYPSTPIAFTLAGNGNTTTPVQYPITVRLLSPTTLQADIPFTVTLAPAPPGTLRGPVLGR
jgi:hypothetical protein